MASKNLWKSECRKNNGNEWVEETSTGKTIKLMQFLTYRIGVSASLLLIVVVANAVWIWRGWRTEKLVERKGRGLFLCHRLRTVPGPLWWMGRASERVQWMWCDVMWWMNEQSMLWYGMVCIICALLTDGWGWGANNCLSLVAYREEENKGRKEGKSEWLIDCCWWYDTLWVNEIEIEQSKARQRDK